MAKLDPIDAQKYEKVATEINEKNDADNEIPEKYGYGVRHLQVLLIFSALTVAFMARAHLNVSIVAMTDVPEYYDTQEIHILTSNNSYFILSTIENTTIINTTNQDQDYLHISTCSKWSTILGSTTELKIHIYNNNDVVFSTIENITAINITNGNEKYIIAQICTCFNESSDISNNHTENVKINDSDILCTDIMKDIINISEIIKNEEDTNIGNIFRVYHWPKSIQELVFGAFFLGYLVMTSPMGLVCQRWGGKLPLQIGLFVSGVVTFFTPWFAYWGGYKAVAATRVIIGLSQAGTYPGLNTLIAKWIPLRERGRLGTYIFTGSTIGAVLSYHISGLLAASSLGWPSIYWLVGILCLIMGVLITVFGASSPLYHPFISVAEKKYILGEFYEHAEKIQPTPWRALLTSRPFWATLIAQLGTSSTYIFFFNQVPTYLHQVVGLNIKNSGLLSSIPYLANFFMSILIGNLSDYFVNKKILSCRTVRILSNGLANFGPATCLIGLSFIKDPTLAVICLILCMGTHAGAHTGWMVNYIDLAPNYSGTLMAIGNTLMNIMAVLLPVLISNVVVDMKNVYQWRIVLFVISSFAIVCNAFFMIFMSSDIQSWNNAVYENIELKEGHKEEETLKK